MNPTDRARVEDVLARHLPDVKMVDTERGLLFTDAGTKGEPECDFCSAAPVLKAYEARDIVRGIDRPDGTTVNIITPGPWRACDICAGFIDEGARGSLLERAFVAHVGKFDAETAPERREQVREQQRHSLRTTQRAFWKARL